MVRSTRTFVTLVLAAIAVLGGTAMAQEESPALPECATKVDLPDCVEATASRNSLIAVNSCQADIRIWADVTGQTNPTPISQIVRGKGDKLETITAFRNTVGEPRCCDDGSGACSQRPVDELCEEAFKRNEIEQYCQIEVITVADDYERCTLRTGCETATDYVTSEATMTPEEFERAILCNGSVQSADYACPE